MRLAWAIVGGVLLGGGMTWWLSRDTPAQSHRKQTRAAAARAAHAEAARASLYRWRDADGVLQVTTQPPHGRKYERIDLQPRAGIEVHGERE